MKDKPTRVLHVVGQLNQGGVENRLMDIYRKINRAKLQFDFVVHGPEEGYFYEEIETMGGRIFHVPKFKVFNTIAYLGAWAKLLVENDYSIIQGHVTSTSFFYMWIAKRQKIKKRIIHARAENKGPIIKRLFTRLSRYHANRFLSVSKIAAISTFGKKIGANAQVIPNAIDANKYVFNSEFRDKFRKEYMIGSDYFLCTHVGRFTHQKNHHFLIDVFKSLANRLDKIKLILVGIGPLKDEITKRLYNENLMDKVLFIGITNEIPAILMASDCLLLPSFYEGFPGIALESQASGLKTFVSDRTTQEIHLTDIIHFLPIEKKNQDTWVNNIVKQTIYDHDNRKKYAEVIKDSPYHIDNTLNIFLNIYALRSM